MRNEELVKRFIDSKAVDFDAIGRLVSELGPQLSTSAIDLKFVLMGRPFIIACMMPAEQSIQLVGDLNNARAASDALK